MLRKHSSGVFLLLTVICNGVRSSDIIQNISYANKALQEFLKNYDQIKKFLESNDSLQSDSTSSENEDNSNMSLHDNQNVKNKNFLFKQIENTSVSTNRPGTAGVYESDSIDDDDINSNSKKITNQVTNKAISPKIHTSKIKKQNNDNKNLYFVKDDTDNNEDSSGYFESEDVEEITLEMPAKTGEITPKEKKIIIKNDKKVLNKQTKTLKNLLGEKTRFSIQHFRSNTSKNASLLKNFRAPLKIEENSRRIKKIIYSETFSPKNIWQEIISRPIKLRKDKDPYIRNDSPSPNNDTITIVILTGKEMEDNHSHEITSELVMDSDQAKLEYLRKTYGDTCLQIPTKKCNKVIKAVKKRVCKEHFKCKSDLKSSFMEYGEKACKEEFDYLKETHKSNSKTQQTEENKPIQPVVFKDEDNDFFIKSTRDRFFNKDYLRKNTNFLNKIALRNNTSDSIIRPKPLFLRDRYERECQEENRRRCINACEYATNKACSKHSCANKKSKAFKKSCKEECHRLFFVNKDSDSDSSDGDSTDSDTDSD